MAKRMLLMLTVVAAVITALGVAKFRQIKSSAQAGAFTPPPEAVTTIVVQRQQWPATMNVVGTVEAVQGVTVSADLPGTVSRINFQSGQAVTAGVVLAELDTRQERAQLAALEAQQELTRVNYGRAKNLFEQGVLARADYDRATADQRENDAKVNEIRATIERKTIRAPFAGVLGIRKVNLGQYLSAGGEIVSLQSLNPIYVNFGVPQQWTGQVQQGRTLRVTTENDKQTFSGRVTAVDSLVDPATRNIQVQATLANEGAKLRPGMFVQVELPLGDSRNVITLPASAVSYAPYGDSVFVVGQMKDSQGKAYLGVRQQFVKVEGSRGDQVAVTSGLNPGDEVVTSGAFKLRNGAPVQVQNKVQPGNNPAPKPEDT